MTTKNEDLAGVRPYLLRGSDDIFVYGLSLVFKPNMNRTRSLSKNRYIIL